MEGAIKHLGWAASLAACVYFATTNQWSPFALHIPLQGSAESGRQPQNAGLQSATSEKKTYSEEDVRQALAALGVATGTGGQGGMAPTGQAGAAPTGPAAGAAREQSAGPAGSQSAAFATIEDPKVARQVVETLGKLEGVTDIPEGATADRVATIFFDPRCPYCHAAFAAMHGKVAARWVPVVVLGEPEAGKRMAAAILAAPDRLAALGSTLEGKSRGEGGEPAAEMLAKLDENRVAFASVFAASPSLRPGVPTMFVPRPDGRLAIMVGYEAGDELKLKSVMTGS